MSLMHTDTVNLFNLISRYKKSAFMSYPLHKRFFASQMSNERKHENKMTTRIISIHLNGMTCSTA